MEGLEGRVLMSFYAAESVAAALGLDRPILDFVVPALRLFWNAGDRGLWSIEDLTARVGPPAV